MSNLLVDSLDNLTRSLQASCDVATSLANRVEQVGVDPVHITLTLRTLAAGLKAQAEFIAVLQAAGAPRGSR